MIINKLKDNIEIFGQFTEVYLFGSALNFRMKPNDVDILLIYDKISNELIQSINKILIKIEKITGIQAHITAMSYSELNETKFLNKLNAKYVKLK